MERRKFIKKSGMVVAGVGIIGTTTFAGNNTTNVNKLPRWRGFNLLDYFSPTIPLSNSSGTTEEDFKWMADWGFDFVRLPMAYPRFLKLDSSENITPDDVYKIDSKQVDRVEELVFLAHKYGLHVSLNLHRAPGFCVNAGFNEPYNLWKDAPAQEAFYFHWEMWAKRFKDVTPDKISFDLVNEPCMRNDMNDQFSQRSAVPGPIYRKVAKKAAETIWGQNADHQVIADGNDIGSSVIPEIADLNIGQSCRGYFPHYISHYRAPWVFENPDLAPMPAWPGEIDGKYFGRKNLEDLYAPWINLVKSGVGVHCGECGCWKETPHQIFLAWFSDVLDILTSNGIGYSLWNFRGDFGILDSGRKDIVYEDWYGHKLDRKLLSLLQKY